MTVRKTPAAKVEPQKPAEDENEHLGPPQVAVLIKKRYQYTRDLMLSGAFGEPVWLDGKKLAVTRKQVNEWMAKQVHSSAS